VQPGIFGIECQLTARDLPAVFDARGGDDGHYRTSTTMCDGHLSDFSDKVRGLWSHGTADSRVGVYPAASTSSMPLPWDTFQVSTLPGYPASTGGGVAW